MLSTLRIFFLQRGQRDRGETIDRSSGILEIQTFRKLPIASPINRTKNNTIVSGVYGSLSGIHIEHWPQQSARLAIHRGSRPAVQTSGKRITEGQEINARYCLFFQIFVLLERQAAYSDQSSEYDLANPYRGSGADRLSGRRFCHLLSGLHERSRPPIFRFDGHRDESCGPDTNPSVGSTLRNSRHGGALNRPYHRSLPPTSS